MGLIKEFKAFAYQGNVLDLAIGVIIGAAFGKIVNSLVEDIITPALLQPALKAANLEDISQLTLGDTGIKYGNFLSEVLAFIIVAFILFIIIRAVNNSKKKKELEPAAPAPDTKEETLLAEIRDLLKK
ncbi:MAG: large conductance mechanosensitive channel protein MscL [Chitinophagaceae bacterium]|jgi:large conductance mechanosensitive channel